MLPIEKRGEIITALRNSFWRIIQPRLPECPQGPQQSTRQRFLAIEFTYAAKKLETEIIMHESGISEETASRLVAFAEKTRNLKDRGLIEGASTRLLIHTAKLISAGIDPKTSCEVAVSGPLTDDHEMLQALSELVSSIF